MKHFQCQFLATVERSRENLDKGSNSPWEMGLC